MIIIVKPNAIYMTHQLIARKRIQEEEKRKHTTSRKRKYNLWDLENAAGYCSSTAQHSALYVNWNNIWIWQHSFSRRLYVIESPRIHFSFGFFDLFDWDSPSNTPRRGETVNGNSWGGGTGMSIFWRWQALFSPHDITVRRGARVKLLLHFFQNTQAHGYTWISSF